MAMDAASAFRAIPPMRCASLDRTGSWLAGTIERPWELERPSCCELVVCFRLSVGRPPMVWFAVPVGSIVLEVVVQSSGLVGVLTAARVILVWRDDGPRATDRLPWPTVDCRHLQLKLDGLDSALDALSLGHIGSRRVESTDLCPDGARGLDQVAVSSEPGIVAVVVGDTVIVLDTGQCPGRQRLASARTVDVQTKRFFFIDRDTVIMANWWSEKLVWAIGPRIAGKAARLHLGMLGGAALDLANMRAVVPCLDGAGFQIVTDATDAADATRTIDVWCGAVRPTGEVRVSFRWRIPAVPDARGLLSPIYFLHALTGSSTLQWGCSIAYQDMPRRLLVYVLCNQRHRLRGPVLPPPPEIERLIVEFIPNIWFQFQP